MLLGAHVSPAGGPANAVERAVERGCESLQIFCQSPRAWKSRVYTDEEAAAFRSAREESPIGAVLIHAVYLINCASDDRAVRDKSRRALTTALRSGAAIGADGVVLHAGSAKAGDVGKAIKRAGTVIRQALGDSEGCALHLENTAGAGGTLGRSFEELAALIEAGGGDERLGLCLDSCHLLASGYEVRTPGGLDETLTECFAHVDEKRLSLHFNDSAAALGSNRDRHARLGAGEIGEKGARVFLSEPRFEGLACVFETPGTASDETPGAEIALARKLRGQGKGARKRRQK